MDDDDFHRAEDAAVSFTAGLIIGAMSPDPHQEEQPSEHPSIKKALETILENIDGREKSVAIGLAQDSGLHRLKPMITCGQKRWEILSEPLSL